MNAAVGFVLRERGFRAGRFTLAMQACNDALAQTGYPDEPSAEPMRPPTLATRE